MNICLVGVGRIGTVHAENIAAHPEAKLAVIADVRTDIAGPIAARYGARATEDAKAAIRAPEIDAVVVASSTDTHLDLTLEAVRAHKPVFCEKPIDQSLALVKEHIAEIRAAGVLVQLGFNRRFHPEFRALRDRAHSGELGPCEIIKITSRDPSPPPIAYIEVSGGLFRDMMIHDFDMARYLLGEEPVALHATASCLVDPAIGAAGDIDTAVVTMKTERGAICSIENSRRAVYGYDQRIEVLCAEGMLQAGWPPNREAHLADPEPEFFTDRYADSFAAEMRQFIDRICGRHDPRWIEVTADDGCAALALAEAAIASLKSGETVATALGQ